MLPPLPTTPLDRPLRVVVLTCGPSGSDTAEALATVANVDVVGVVRAPFPKPKTFAKRLKLLLKRQGLAGLVRVPLNRVRALLDRGGDDAAPRRTVPLVAVDSFVSAEGLDALRALAPDLAVVDGTNVLKEATFGLPRYGSINLHCGRLPDYKGAPPGFWELFHGEQRVGVTIHRVTAALDAGPILAQEITTLDPVPAGDPMRYLQTLLEDTLRPIGVRLLQQVVGAIARGEAHERPQGPTDNPTFRFPDITTVRELRRRVRRRRAEGAAAR
jgi:folate-dependent phosphoribosylglycinamide formyltransferase PurN